MRYPCFTLAADMTKVLIADDLEIARTALTTHLTGCGYQVVAVENGADAIAAATTDQVDFMILDISMPHATGPEVVESLRERGITIPFIYITAEPCPETIWDAVQLGAVSWYPKSRAWQNLQQIAVDIEQTTRGD